MKKLLANNGLYIFITMLLPQQIFAYSSPDVHIESPSTTDVNTIIGNIIGWVLVFSGSLAILFIIWGGFLYISSAGNKEKIDAAKKTLTFSIGGLVLVILARLIVELLQNSIGSII